MATYAVLKARIADELNRADLTSQIALAIQSAIDHWKYKRFWMSEKVILNTTTASLEYQPYPTETAGDSNNLLKLDSLLLDSGSGYYRLIPKSAGELDYWSQGSADTPQIPYFFADYANAVRLYPIPNDAYNLKWEGVVEPTPSALSNDADTNFWTTQGEALIRQRAKAILRIDILASKSALMEAGQIAARGEEFLCIMEKAAHTALMRQTTNRVSTGRLSRRVI